MFGFKYAVAGLSLLVQTQRNARIHILAALLVTAAGLFFCLSPMEWIPIVLAVASVWITEALNTAIECLADVVSPAYHPKVKQAKDLAAGAVLLAAVGSILVGLLIFGPHVLQMIHCSFSNCSPR
jgi:diacylglycerol kinase (ATP)